MVVYSSKFKDVAKDNVCLLLLVQEAAAATGAAPAGGGPDLRTEAEEMLKDLGIPDTGRGISDTGRGDQ